MKYIRLFNSPHPFIFNAYSMVIPSIITFLMVVILAPFHFKEFELMNRIGIGFLTSITVAIVIFSSVKILQKVFPKIMAEDNWTVGKEFTLILFVVAILSILISIFLWFINPNYQSFEGLLLKTSFITLGISIFPVLVLILFEQFRYHKKQLQKVEKLNKSLHQKNTLRIKEIISEKEIDLPLLIKSEKGQIELKILPQELIYVKSEGNYLEVYYNHTNYINKQLIRNTLKNIEKILPNHIFLRCHNRFIINGYHILKVEGNARNLMLHLKNVSEPIPVSRLKAKSISEFFNEIS